MEFTLFSGSELPFDSYQLQNSKKIVKSLNIPVSTLQSTSSSNLTAKFITKLEGLLLAHLHWEGNKRQRLSCHSMLRLRLYYDPVTKYVAPCVIDDSRKTGGLLKRLARICGGHQNVRAKLKLEFGTEEDKMTLNWTNLEMQNSEDLSYAFSESFKLTGSLAKKWSNQANYFSGTLSLSLKLNCEAMSKIHVGSLGDGALVNRKLLENAKFSGDALIVLESGKKFYCHKAFLSAHSEVFEADLRSRRMIMQDISEEGLKAMLDYLYCGDIAIPLSCCEVTLELLRVSMVYEVPRLFKAMKELILDREHKWFSLGSVVHLLRLAWSRRQIAEELEELKKKGTALFKMISVNEWMKCAELKRELNFMDKCAIMDKTLVWIKLLKVAEEQGTSWLGVGETVKKLIIEMESSEISVNAAVQLMMLANTMKKVEGFKKLKDKAEAVLKLKPAEELKQCSLFRELVKCSGMTEETRAYLSKRPLNMALIKSKNKNNDLFFNFIF